MTNTVGVVKNTNMIWCLPVGVEGGGGVMPKKIHSSGKHTPPKSKWIFIYVLGGGLWRAGVRG